MTSNNKTIPSIFTVKFGTIVQYIPELLLADATSLPIKLYSCNSKYYDSTVCRRMMVALTSEQIKNEISEGNVILASSTVLYNIQNVMVMTDEFVRIPKNVNNAEGFLNYLMIIDRLCVDINYVFNSNSINWLHRKISKIKLQHIQYDKLFTPVEYKDFICPKFGPLVAGVPYPVGFINNNNNYKPIKMNIINKKSHDIVVFTEILTILNRYKKNCPYNIKNIIDTIISKIIIIAFVDIDKYPTAFNINFLKEINNDKILCDSLKYAIRTMYLKECTYFKFGHDGLTTDLSSFVIPLQIACLLPQNNDLNGTYACSMIRHLNCASKWLIGPVNIKGHRGVCTLDEFTGKFNIYTNNVFKNVSFNKNTTDGQTLYNMAITGSAITACAIENPRENEFTSFYSFLNYFYPMPVPKLIKKCTQTNEYDQMTRSQQSQQIQQTITKNTLFEEISEELSENEPDNTNNTKKSYESSKSSKSEEPNESEESSESEESDSKVLTKFADIDLAVECNFEDFDKSVEFIFAEIKMNYPHATLHKKKTENKHKYIVEDIPRFIDIFHVTSIPYVVSKFHLDCVRAWFDGVTVHCFPTFICAANTSMCSDIRWVSNQKDVRDVIMKYHHRGFGTYINTNDMLNLQSYLNPANGYQPTGLTPGMSQWQRRRIMREPVYGNCAYFGPNYIKKRRKFMKMTPLLKNEVLMPYM